MKREENLLFKELCKFKKETFDEDLLRFATPHVLGFLFFNRMQGIAYDRMRRQGLLGKVNREFRNSLKSAFDQNVIKNHSFAKCVKMVAAILNELDCKAAMLKGAFLCNHYPEGYRTSNDIDLLVRPEDVTTVGNALLEAGFKQGNVRNGEFVPASRKEIIESKMMRGETVPYIKLVDLPNMKYLEVDINFSLDYKNGETDVLENILEKADVINENGILLPTLSKEDFFIHLCAHLYKEATTLPWVEMHRDMTLYKYCDIYMLLFEMEEKDIDTVFARAKELNMEKVCAYTIIEASDLFDIDSSNAKLISESVLADDRDFILTVVSPRDKKLLKYQTANATERFFMEERVADLKEV